MINIKNTTLKVIIVLILAAISSCNFEKNKNWKEMVWNDEFDYSGLPDSAKWEFEEHGLQYGCFLPTGNMEDGRKAGKLI